MGLGAPHVLGALDPSDLSIVRMGCTGHGLWKHILTKKLRCGRPNPVHVGICAISRDLVTPNSKTLTTFTK